MELKTSNSKLPKKGLRSLFGKLLSKAKSLFRSQKSLKTKNPQKRPKLSQKLLKIPVNIADEVLHLPQEIPFNPSNHFPKLPEVQVSHAIEEFSLVQLSVHSRRAYQNDLRDFFSFLRLRGVWKNWNEQLTPLFVAEYREYLFVDKRLAKSSVTRKLAVLKSFCRWALARGWLLQNPADLVKSFPQTQESKTPYLSLPEIKRLLDSFPSIENARLSRALDRVVCETLAMLGLRRSEAASIHMKDIERLEETWVLRVHGKGDRDRVLPLPERLLETWSAWLLKLHPDSVPTLSIQEDIPSWNRWLKINSALPLLVSTRSTSFETPISTSEIARCVRKSARRAGLIQKLSPHALRATAITHALDEGASHRGIQQMAGWTSPLMITRYDKRRKDHRFSAIHSLSYAKKVKNEECPEKPLSLELVDLLDPV